MYGVINRTHCCLRLQYFVMQHCERKPQLIYQLSYDSAFLIQLIIINVMLPCSIAVEFARNVSLCLFKCFIKLMFFRIHEFHVTALKTNNPSSLRYFWVCHRAVIQKFQVVFVNCVKHVTCIILFAQTHNQTNINISTHKKEILLSFMTKTFTAKNIVF